MKQTPSYNNFIAIVAVVAILAMTMMVFRAPDSSFGGLATASFEEFDEPLTAEDLGYAPDTLLVQFKAGTGKDKANSILNRHGAIEAQDLEFVKIIKVPPQALNAVETALAKNPAVQFVEKDYVEEVTLLTNDPQISSQYYVNLMRYPEAWNSLSNPSTVLVSAPDSGIDTAHSDLIGVLRMDLAYNMYRENTDITAVSSHGTNTAGLIGAHTNNAVGIAAAVHTAQIIPIKVSVDDGSTAYRSDMAQAIKYAADKGAKVVSISFGCNVKCASATAADSTIVSAANYLESKGGVFFLAAANEGGLMSFTNYPSIILVGATDSSDNRASWSNYGTPLDIVAPGVGTYTTNKGGGYSSPSGTSFASPVAASVAALLYSQYPSATPSQIKNAIFSSAKDLGATGYDIYYGNGRVDAAGAMLAMQGTTTTPTPTDSTAPTVSFQQPLAGAIVSCSNSVTVSASDASGINKVELFIDGALIGTSSSGSNGVYSFFWDVASYSDGYHNLTAQAYDNYGNKNIASTYVTLQKDLSAPTISIASPADGATGLTGTVTITAHSSLNTHHVDFHANGAFIGSDNVAPFSYAWSTKGSEGKTVTLKATAYNCNDVYSDSSISVSVATATKSGKGGSGGGGKPSRK